MAHILGIRSLRVKKRNLSLSRHILRGSGHAGGSVIMFAMPDDSKPQGSKDPNKRALGPKYHEYHSICKNSFFWVLEPLGTFMLVAL